MSCKQFSIFVFTLLLIASCNLIKNETQKPNLKIWYHQPADASVPDNPNGWKDDPEWLKALPLGNGSLGVMVFGDVNLERLQLSAALKRKN